MAGAEVESIRSHDDKRVDERYSSHAPIIFSFFGTKFQREFASMTFNHSKNGLCLEAAEEIKPGTTLFIRRGSVPAEEPYRINWKPLRNTSLGEVRWCRELEDKFGTYYCVGVRYY
jgi:hypothetical protein